MRWLAPPIAIDWESMVYNNKSTASSTSMVNHLITAKLSSVQDDTMKNLISFLESIKMIKDNDNAAFTIGQIFVEDWMSDRTDGYNLGLRVQMPSTKDMQEWIDSSSYTSLCDMIHSMCADSLVQITWESKD